MPDAITIRGLTKAYGGKNAVDGLDLDIHTGECFALLGPNGAGKTTTVEIAEGFRPRDAGEVRVLGTDPQGAGLEWRNRVGIVLQSHRRPGPAHPARGARQHREGLLAPARRRRRARLGRPRRQGRHPHRRPERRPAAPARRGARHRRPPRAALPRRADHRLRPAGPPRLLGAHPRRWPPRAPRSCSPPTTSTRPRTSPTGSGSSPPVGCSPSTPPRRSAAAARRRRRSPGRRTASAAASRPSTPTAEVARLAARMPGGEVPALTVTRPSLEDTYLTLIAPHVTPETHDAHDPTEVPA